METNKNELQAVQLGMRIVHIAWGTLLPRLLSSRDERLRGLVVNLDRAMSALLDDLNARVRECEVRLARIDELA